MVNDRGREQQDTQQLYSGEARDDEVAEHFNLVQNVIVNRLDDKTLLSQCSYLSSFQEASAWMTANAADFVIRGAGLEVYRSTDEQPGYYGFPELAGLEAYLHSGSNIKNIIGRDQQLARELISECVKGIIQAEFFLYEERGYPTQQDYFDHWCAINDKTCYTFSHQDEVEGDWSQHATGVKRKCNLFNRSHVLNFEKGDNGGIVSGTFIDTYHEINILLRLDKRNVVLDARAAHGRIPDKVCVSGAAGLPKLVGHSLAEMKKKEIIYLVGHRDGCIHLSELVYDACRLIRAAGANG